MSKVFCTLAWYHDGGTLKPQLMFQSTPGTNLVMKGTDWKEARFKNMNATVGSRDRFEYSFTGGRHVTRASLVINTSVILPPMLWLSNHPAGAPTKTGPRGDPKWKALEEAKRVHEAKQKGIEYIPDDDPGKRMSERHKERRKKEKKEREERAKRQKERKAIREDEEDEEWEQERPMLEDRPSKRETFPPRSRRQFTNMENRSYDFTDEVNRHYRAVPDVDTRRRERQRRLRASTSPLPARPSFYDSPSPAYEYIQPEKEHYEASQSPRQSRLRSSSAPDARYRRSNRRNNPRGAAAGDDGENDDGDG